MIIRVSCMQALHGSINLGQHINLADDRKPVSVALLEELDRIKEAGRSTINKAQQQKMDLDKEALLLSSQLVTTVSRRPSYVLSAFSYNSDAQRQQ